MKIWSIIFLKKILHGKLKVVWEKEKKIVSKTFCQNFNRHLQNIFMYEKICKKIIKFIEKQHKQYRRKSSQVKEIISWNDN